MPLHELSETDRQRVCPLPYHAGTGGSIHERQPAKFEWTSDAGNQRYGLFCGSCGGRIANGQTPSIGVFSLRAGTLDDTSWLHPTGHIWVKSAQAWMRFADDDVCHDGQPENYAPYVEQFRQSVSLSNEES